MRWTIRNPYTPEKDAGRAGAIIMSLQHSNRAVVIQPEEGRMISRRYRAIRLERDYWKGLAHDLVKQRERMDADAKGNTEG